MGHRLLLLQIALRLHLTASLLITRVGRLRPIEAAEFVGAEQGCGTGADRDFGAGGHSLLLIERRPHLTARFAHRHRAAPAECADAGREGADVGEHAAVNGDDLVARLELRVRPGPAQFDDANLENRTIQAAVADHALHADAQAEGAPLSRRPGRVLAASWSVTSR